MQNSIFLLCASIAFLACSSDYNTAPKESPIPPTLASVVLSATANSPLASRGDSRTISAVVKNTDQSTVPSPTLTWTSSAPTVATVTGTGANAAVTAIDDGTATISASSGNITGTIVVNVHRKIASISMTADDPIILIGESTRLVVHARDARFNEMPLNTSVFFSTSNSNSISVTQDGIATAVFNPFGVEGANILATVSTDEGLGLTTAIDIGTRNFPTGFFDFAGLLLAENTRPTPVRRPAQGIVYFAFDADQIHYRIVWSGFASAATSAHIHGPATTNDVTDVLVEIVPPATGDRFGRITSTITAGDIKSVGGRPPISIDSLSALMRSGKLYVDLHSPAFAGGEVRGQVTGPFR